MSSKTKPYQLSGQANFEKAALAILLFIVVLPVLYIPIYYGDGNTWLNQSSAFTYVGGLAALGLCLIYLGKMISANSRLLLDSLKARPWLIFLLAALVWTIPATLGAENLSVAFWGHDHRRDGLFLFFCYAGVLGTALILQNRKYKLLLFRVMVIAAIPVCGVMLGQYFGDFYTTIGIGETESVINNAKSSVFLNANHMGYYQAITLVALAGIMLEDYLNPQLNQRSKIIREALGTALLGFFTWCLIINNTFGCYLAILIGLVFLALIFTIVTPKKFKKLFFWVPLATVLAVTLLICFGFGSTQVVKTFKTNYSFIYGDLPTLFSSSGAAEADEELTSTSTARLELWRFTWEMIKKEPILGYGADSVSQVMTAAKFNTANQDRTHNEYLQYASYFGLPFLFFWAIGLGILFIQQLVRILRRSSLDPGALIALGALLTYLASAFVGVSIFYTAVYCFMLIGLAATLPAPTNPAGGQICPSKK